MVLILERNAMCLRHPDVSEKHSLDLQVGEKANSLLFVFSFNSECGCDMLLRNVFVSLSYRELQCRQLLFTVRLL
jgi:hypothetical protein